jgi:acetyltransferase-like isoleucine patch superfamily enzyme
MPIMPSIELDRLALGSVGEGALISDRASFYGASRVHLGRHVRIDDFCVISAGAGGIYIGDYVHIGVGTTLIGAGRIEIGDFVNLSSRVAIYSSSDDYSGQFMAGPMIPAEYTRFDTSPVNIGRHVIIGSGSVVLPGAHLPEGVAIGALSLVKGTCEPFWVYAGAPARAVKPRQKSLLEHERRFFEARSCKAPTDGGEP